MKTRGLSFVLVSMLAVALTSCGGAGGNTDPLAMSELLKERQIPCDGLVVENDVWYVRANFLVTMRCSAGGGRYSIRFFTSDAEKQANMESYCSDQYEVGGDGETVVSGGNWIAFGWPALVTPQAFADATGGRLSNSLDLCPE